jgi:hypothetical protein
VVAQFGGPCHSVLAHLPARQHRLRDTKAAYQRARSVTNTPDEDPLRVEISTRLAARAD